MWCGSSDSEERVHLRDRLDRASVAKLVHLGHDLAKLLLARVKCHDEGSKQIVICLVIPGHTIRHGRRL